MPGASCRDVDEVCDWFLREEKPENLLVSTVTHFEEQHAVLFGEHMASRGPAVICKDFMTVWRDFDQTKPI